MISKRRPSWIRHLDFPERLKTTTIGQKVMRPSKRTVGTSALDLQCQFMQQTYHLLHLCILFMSIFILQCKDDFNSENDTQSDLSLSCDVGRIALRGVSNVSSSFSFFYC